MMHNKIEIKKQEYEIEQLPTYRKETEILIEKAGTVKSLGNSLRVFALAILAGVFIIFGVVFYPWALMALLKRHFT